MVNPILQTIGIIAGSAFTYSFNKLWILLKKKEEVSVFRMVFALIIGGIFGFGWFFLNSQVKVVVQSNFESEVYLDGNCRETTTDKQMVLYTSIGTHYIKADYAGSDLSHFYEPHIKEVNIGSYDDIRKGLLGNGFPVKIQIKRGKGVIMSNINPSKIRREVKITIQGLVEGENITIGPEKPRRFSVDAGKYTVTAEYKGKQTEPDHIVVLGSQTEIAWFDFDLSP